MPKSGEDVYDAIIIGAGIGGLVCGCYLAKAGMKVLICEQHNKPGGYCTSFKRGKFMFDAAAHSFGGYKHGILGKIFKDLAIEKKIEFLQFDPSDVVVTPDYKVFFWRKLNKTINGFQTIFPKERDNIEKFFHSFINPDSKLLACLRRMTFKNVLDQYFTDDKLKTILAFPLFGYMGLPPSQIAAFLGIGIFKECILDGGYYPKGGMQVLSDALAKLFKESGGVINLSCHVNKIRVKDKEVTGVFLEKTGFIRSKYVISNCDARQTFFDLLGNKIISHDFHGKMRNMIPSLSSFILYLGIDSRLELPDSGTNMWVLSDYDLDSVYFSAKQGTFSKTKGNLLHVSSDKKSLIASIFAPYKSKKYWDTNKMIWEDSFIKRIEMDIVPKLSQHILHRESATPHTLHRYTLNYRGAAFGWAGVPLQVALPDLNRPSFIQGMYLTGHWTTRGLGIPGVTYVAYDTAKSILRKEERIAGRTNFHG